MEDSSPGEDTNELGLPDGVTVLHPPRPIQLLIPVLYLHTLINALLSMITFGFVIPIAANEADDGALAMAQLVALIAVATGPTIPLAWVAATRMTTRPRSARTALVWLVLLAGTQAVAAMYLSMTSIESAVVPMMCCPMFVVLEVLFAAQGDSRRWLRLARI